MTDRTQLLTSLPHFLSLLTLLASAGAVSGTVEADAAGMLVRVVMIAGRGLQERVHRSAADTGMRRGLGVSLGLGVFLPEGDG